MSQLSQTMSKLSVVALPSQKKGRTTTMPLKASSPMTTMDITFLCPISFTPQTIRSDLAITSSTFPTIAKVTLRPYQLGLESQLAHVSFSSQECANITQASLSHVPPLFILSASDLAAPLNNPAVNICHQLEYPSSFCFDPTACMVSSCPYHQTNAFHSLDTAQDHTIYFHGEIFHALGSQSLLGHYGWAQCPYCLMYLTYR